MAAARSSRRALARSGRAVLPANSPRRAAAPNVAHQPSRRRRGLFRLRGRRRDAQFLQSTASRIAPSTSRAARRWTATTANLIAAVRSTGRTAVVVAEGDPAPLVLRVGGMTCGHCSAQVEQALAAVAGVTAAEVDLASGLATVAGTATPEALVAAVEATGKTAAVDGAAAPVVLRVGGMTCGHCSAQVEAALAAVAGVTTAHVDLEAGLATVEGAVAPEALVAAVAATGKTAALAGEGAAAAPAPSDASDLPPRMRRSLEMAAREGGGGGRGGGGADGGGAARRRHGLRPPQRAGRAGARCGGRRHRRQTSTWRRASRRWRARRRSRRSWRRSRRRARRRRRSAARRRPCGCASTGWCARAASPPSSAR